MKTRTFYMTELINQRLDAAAAKHGITPSAYIRRVILVDLAKLGLITIDELIENQMSDTPYGQGRGTGHLKKRQRAEEKNNPIPEEDKSFKPKTKTILS